MRIRLALLAVGAIAASATVLAGGASAGGPNGNVSFLTGPRTGDPVQIAIDYIRGHKQQLGLTGSDLADVVVADKYASKDTGVTHIYLSQRHKGIEVFNAVLNVNVAKDGSVVNAGNRFVSNLSAAVNSASPGKAASEAVQSAASDLGLKPRGLAVKESKGGATREMEFNQAGISLEPITAKLVYEPVAGGKVRLAWQVEVYEPDAQHWWNLRVDATTGNVLAKSDYVDSEGSYNVFAIPKESPNIGPRTLEVDPAVSPASPFDWHDTNGIPGAEFTITRGNNVFAYTDVDANNRPDPGSSPGGGAGLVFNFPLDLTQQPEIYRPAAVTNLFYWNNVIHDVFYGYGFDEAAGNFQANNYARGGTATDAVNAEAQDGSGLNNANFATPPDGNSPRMQMFEWTYPFSNNVRINAPPAIAGNYAASGAAFGPQLSDTGPITGDVTLVNDGTAPVTDGCQAFDVPDGNIAMVDRGLCNFTVKVKNAQNTGAVGVIVVQNTLGSPFTMGGTDSSITIPSVMVRKSDGDAFKANLTGLNATLEEASGSLIPPNRDSDLDSGVIAHEYGHGISNRLTGGPSRVACLKKDEQMGEGWSDFIALVLTARPSDTATTSRGIGNYVVYEDPTGFGIRPTPYTTDTTVNGVTYGDIGGLAVPHGVGYAWASMLWEVYWNLIADHGFNPSIYGAWSTGGNNLALQLVVDGMKLQPCDPGFVDGRDAILLADQLLTDGVNQCAIWNGFAKRGLGVNAIQGSTHKVGDEVEDFDVPAACS
jgi:extracellular elastinolytic metalloproteinase